MGIEKDIPVNPERGEVPLPEAGEGLFLRFDVDALERLEGKFGEDYIDAILKGLSKVNVKVYQTVIATAIRSNTGNGVTMDREVPFGMSFEKLQVKILDALYMTIHGRTYEQQREYESQIAEEHVERLKSDPQVRDISILDATRQAGYRSGLKPEEIRRYTPHEIFTYAKFMGEENLNKAVNAAWLTAMLTATGTNAPKSFPTSPDDLLKKFKPPKPMNKRQWEVMFEMLFAAHGENKGADAQTKPLN